MSRSDQSSIYNTGKTHLARLRLEKLDDNAIKDQISYIQSVCENVHPDIIAVVFHECDHNINQTITRLQEGDFEDGGWQTAKTNNRKKNQNTSQNVNGVIKSDDENSNSQRISPTISSRDNGGGRRRDEQNQYSSSRTHNNRRGNNSGRNYAHPSNLRNSSRHNSENNNHKSSLTERSSNQLSKQIDDTTAQLATLITIGDGVIIDPKETLTFENNEKKSSISSSKRRVTPSATPQKPVTMHPTVQLSILPTDFQFGDIQWNDSQPIVVLGSNNSMPNNTEDDQQSSSFIDSIKNEQQQTYRQNEMSIDQKDYRVSNMPQRSPESSLSITDTNVNDADKTIIDTSSHLSDHLTNSSQQQQQQQHSTNSTIPSTAITGHSHVSPTSASNTLFDTSSISQNNSSFSINQHQQLSNVQTNSLGGSSAFTPHGISATFSSYPKDNSFTSPHYKTVTKGYPAQHGNFSQQQIYQQQQPQLYFQHYNFPTPSPCYPMMHPIDSWVPSIYEVYPSYPTNCLPSYSPSQQQQYPTAHVQQVKQESLGYDKEYFSSYSQSRLSNNETLNSTQTNKDAPVTSKLSANAASFSQGAQLATPNPAVALTYPSVLYPFPSYYGALPERTCNAYGPADIRDNRSGASHGSNHNRNSHYHHRQQHQRTNNNNSTWHSQQ